MLGHPSANLPPLSSNAVTVGSEVSAQLIRNLGSAVRNGLAHCTRPHISWTQGQLDWEWTEQSVDRALETQVLISFATSKLGVLWQTSSPPWAQGLHPKALFQLQKSIALGHP